jgi:hypothetical protein
MNKKKKKKEEGEQKEEGEGEKKKERRHFSQPHKEQITHSSVTQFIAWSLSCPGYL